MTERNEDLNATFNRLLAIASRRRWWIFVTCLVVSLGTILVSYIMPSRYRSEATIFVHKEHAPERYVIPNDTVNSMAELSAMTSQMLSSTNLLRIIGEFNLYPGERNHLDSGALMALMRSNIEVQPLNKNPERSSSNAFMIAFTGDDPRTAQQVVSRLIALFIEGNQQTQTYRDTGMTNFLQNELETANANLTKQEAILRDFKAKNLGQLPQQEQGNVEILTGLQIQLQTAQNNLARLRQQRAYLQAMLAQSGQGVAPSSLRATQIATLRSDIARLRVEREDLLSRYSTIYPDVIRLDQRISNEEVRLNQLLSAPEPSDTTASQAPVSTVATDPGTVQLKSQLEANRMETADAEREVAQIYPRIADYRSRLNVAPLREQQLAEVSRNYDLAKQNYSNLVNKKTESELATKLTTRQLDEQFQIIDPPSLPFRAISPYRPGIALGGLVGGLVLGVILALFIEASDHSLRSLKEVHDFISVPLLFAIPPLRTSMEERKCAQNSRIGLAIESVTFVLVLASQLYVFWKG